MEKNACYDIPDERDYKYTEVFEEEIFWAILPQEFLMDNVEYQNQWLEEVTQMMCVYYSTGHWSNEENFQEWSDVRIPCKDLWLRALALWRLDVNKWSLVSDGPKTARDSWLIKWWALVNSVDSIKHSLIQKRPVVVWSFQLDWSAAKNSPHLLKWPKWSAHAVLIIWYDDEIHWWSFIIKNSYGSEKYDWWKMYLKYSDFWLLFHSKYSLIDQEDPILSYKENVMSKINIPMAKVWYELWLWNWDNATGPVSREESVTIILRAIQKMINWEITEQKLNELIAKYEEK